MIVKHANPCGVAVGATIEEAYDKALASDPVSAYGGIVVLNRDVAGALGEKLTEQFVEVLFAPGYDDAALEALRRKQNTRILVDRERRRARRGGTGDEARPRRHPRPGRRRGDRGAGRLAGGVRHAGRGQWGDLVFAWRVCKHVSSNAIVLVKDLATIGIGAGR